MVGYRDLGNSPRVIGSLRHNDTRSRVGEAAWWRGEERRHTTAALVIDIFDNDRQPGRAPQAVAEHPDTR